MQKHKIAFVLAMAMLIFMFPRLHLTGVVDSGFLFSWMWMIFAVLVIIANGRMVFQERSVEQRKQHELQEKRLREQARQQWVRNR